MQRPLNIAVIGAGGIAAKLHLPELGEQSHRAQVALLIGRSAARLGVLGEQCGARWSQNFDEVLIDDSIDAVVVATPHPQHKVCLAHLQNRPHFFRWNFGEINE